jgi:aspartate ammonia-lyase
MMPVMASTLLDATGVSTQAVDTLRTRCIDGLEANEEKLRKYFESTPQVATALSPKLGYEATAKLVQESLKVGKSVVDLVREKKLIPEAELLKLLDPKVLTGDS